MNSLEKYAKQVKRHLRVDRKTKERIVEGLMAEFEYALSNGETENEILTRMGAASQMAADYNSSYKNDPDYQANRKYAIARTVSIVSLILTFIIVGIAIGLQVYTMNHTSVSSTGGVSGPANVEITSAPITFFDLIQNARWFIAIPLVVFVLSAVYCIVSRIRRKKVNKYEKN